MGRGQEVTVTNDGATILKSVYVDNPAAKVLQGKPRMTQQQQQQQSSRFIAPLPAWPSRVFCMDQPAEHRNSAPMDGAVHARQLRGVPAVKDIHHVSPIMAKHCAVLLAVMTSQA